MDTQNLTTLFLELIHIDAVSGNEKSIAQYLTDYLKNLGLAPYEDGSAAKTGCNTGNIICKVNGGGDFVLLSHMDTARPTKHVKPVFYPDRITSDGTTVLGVDDRLGMSAILYAVKVAIEEGIPIRPFTIAFTTCEETTLLGSVNLELDESIKNGYVFDSYLPTGTFVNESCGAVTLNFKLNGKASHSGIAPEKGINAIQIAVEALSSFPFGRINADTTANIGIIQGGEATNVVPETVMLEGEIRSKNPAVVEEYAAKVKQTFEQVAKKYGGSADCDIRWDFRPYTITQADEPYQRICKVLKTIGLEPKPSMSFGGSDANSLNAKGIKTVNLGTGAQNPHANDEFVLLKDLENSARIALELIKA